MKKIVLTCFAAAAFFPAIAQKTATITGKVPASLNGKSIMLFNGEGYSRKVLDSAVVTNGGFNFNYELTDTVRGSVFITYTENDKRKAGSIGLMLTPTDRIKIVVGKSDDEKVLNDVKITGSELTRQYDELTGILQDVNRQFNDLRTEMGKLMSAQPLDSVAYSALLDKNRSLMKEQDVLMSKFIDEHPGYYISLLAFVSKMGNRVTDVEGMKMIFGKFTPAIRQSSLGLEAEKVLSESARLAINQVAPDFSATTPEGKTMKLSDLRGKYVLLDFWASWCGPCRAENPHVVKAWQRFHDKNFDVLGVSLDKPDAADKWKAAIEKDGLTWNHVSDLKYWNSDIAKLYMVRSIPQNFLLDPQGKIIAVNLRGEALEKALEQLIN